MPRSPVLVAIGAAAVLAGCGGGSGGKDTPARSVAKPAGTDVIAGWADDIRHGRWTAAAGRFALPATVANGSPEIVLRTRTQAEQFGQSLACGAVVTGTRAAAGGRLVATFRLTERAGGIPSCGQGTGATAEVLVRIRDGHIAEWLRVVDGPGAAGGTEV